MADRHADTTFCIVETTSGKVRGIVNSGLRQFKAVPYGASTAGANRFKRPHRPAPWSLVRDCFGYGPVSPQLPTDLGNDYARLMQLDLSVAVGGMSEECLHLNIWTPGVNDNGKRAVLVSFHGGGFAIGSGNAPIYDGARLARFGDVVIVTVTHRLASFGFLNLADIGAPREFVDAGVAGILDLVAALEWVRDNIAQFGGDSGRVMIFGQSGGGWKVSALLATPAARGLFHRAAVQSGSLLRHLTREEGARVADAFVTTLGVSKSRLADIQELPWTQLLAAQMQVGMHAFAPVLDGVTLARDPFDPLAPIDSADVPVIVSTTLDDAGLFFTNFGLDETEIKTLLRKRYGDSAEQMLALYREGWPAKSAFLLYAQMITDSGFRHFANLQAERKAELARAPVYTYLWEWASPAYDAKFGAAHAMDVSASFYNDRDGILGSGSRDAQIMCECLASTWVSFAKTGNPNNASIPHWPAFDLDRRSTMILGNDTRTVRDPYKSIREFWLDMPAPGSVLG